MRVYLWILVVLVFSFCENSSTKNDKLNLEKGKLFNGNLFEYKGIYDKSYMVDCPDYVRFLSDGNYYVKNDCATRIEYDPRIDTIAETGRYKYDKTLKKLSFFGRKLTVPSVGQIFSSDLDTIHLEIVKMSKDTLIFKRYKLNIYKRNELDTLPVLVYFAKAR